MDFSNHLAILSAMPEEVGSILNNLINTKSFKFGDLVIYKGYWIHPKNKKIIKITTAWSGWGKVSAARATTRILGLNDEELSIELIIFTGVAGAINNNLKQWDVVLADEVCQYDVDATPIFEKFVIPPLNKKYLIPQEEIHKWAFNALLGALGNIELSKFGLLFSGLIGTADKFISQEETRNIISQELPLIQAVEMEGAAFAQVACQEKIPWLLLRVISDTANNKASQNFNDFLKDYSKYSWNLIEVLLMNF